MLLRSSSTPILNSWIPHAKDSSPVPFTLTASSSPCDSLKSMTRTLSETDLRSLPLPKKKATSNVFNGLALEEKEDESETASFDGGWLGKEACEIGVLVGGGIYGGGGNMCGGGGGSDGGDGDGRWGSWDPNNHGNNSTDLYYQKMIQADPRNPLLLSNYARFLKETRGDLLKAEEYCARAILMSPNDGNVLSMYGDLIWQSHKDASRAESYFDQAVKAAPDDCYVLASHAHFLWDADEDEEDEQVGEEPAPPSYNFQQRPPLPPHLAAAY